ncbi:hypothetical protein [Nostoc sp.]
MRGIVSPTLQDATPRQKTALTWLHRGGLHEVKKHLAYKATALFVS